MNLKERVIKQIVISRKTLFEIILVAIFISFGTNIIVNSVFRYNNINNLILIIIGISLILIPSLILIFINFKKFDRQIKISGFFIYDKKKNKIIEIDNYDLSYEMSTNLKGAFAEDKSLKKIWDKYPLERKIGYNKEIKKYGSKELLVELFEYIILNKLSITLTDFFAQINLKNKKLMKYKREDIPDILLSNKFLNLFSKPMQEREAFIDDMWDDKGIGKTVSATGEHGEIFNEFELVLPKKSTVKRFKPSCLLIETDFMKIYIKINFEGYGTVLPTDFLNLYLDIDWNRENTMRYMENHIGLELKINFKIKSLISKDGWKYHLWIEKYIESLRKEISKEYFFNSINWNVIRTLLYTMDYKKIKSIRSKLNFSE